MFSIIHSKKLRRWWTRPSAGSKPRSSGDGLSWRHHLKRHLLKTAILNARKYCLYVDRFNRHDWDGVRELISADARLLFANGFAGRLTDSPYFVKYDEVDLPWRMVLGYVDGEPVIVRLHPVDSVWTPESVIRLEVNNNQVVRIVDYLWCPWLLP